MNPLALLSNSPIAASADPFTSHKAAREITAAGSRAYQQNICLGAVKQWPGLTSAELARELCSDRFMTGRRLPELRAASLLENGLPKLCSVTGHVCITWWLRGSAPKAAA